MASTEELTFLNSTCPPVNLNWGNTPRIVRFKQYYYKLHSIRQSWKIQVFSAATGELHRTLDLHVSMCFARLCSIDDSQIVIKCLTGGDTGCRLTIDAYDTDDYRISQEPDESGDDEYGIYPDYDSNFDAHVFEYRSVYGSKLIEIPGGKAESRGWKTYMGDMKTTVLIFNRIQEQDQYVSIMLDDDSDCLPVTLKTLGDPIYGYPEMKTNSMCDMRCEDTDSYVCTDAGCLWKLEHRDWQWHCLGQVVELSPRESPPIVGCATDTCVLLQSTSDDNTTQRVFVAYMEPLTLAEIAFHMLFKSVGPSLKHKMLEAKTIDTTTILELLKIA